MKEITKERTKVEEYTAYQAVDGTEFSTKEECMKYEQSALGVLRGRLRDYIVSDKYDCWELFRGYEDHKCLALNVPTEEAIDTILQNYYLDNPWTMDDSHKSFRLKVENAVRQAYENNDIIFFGLNCEDELYLIDTRINIISRLNNLDRKEEKK